MGMWWLAANATALRADRLPRFFVEEPLAPHGEVFDVSGIWLSRPPIRTGIDLPTCSRNAL